ncbi:hypothetical protein DVH05_001548 [Phytophthora capsici]|nr:hypothetical protein DVH05_001548 [Phytophthora capsici]
MDTALNSAVLAQQRMRDDTRSPFGENVTTYERLYRLVVTPIVKTAVSQRDTSGDALEVYAVEGQSFTAILKKLWKKFREHMKGRAVKNQNEWSIVAPSMEKWSQMMQFKSKRHLVDSTKTEQAWNVWLNTIRGESVKLLVFEYGAAITTPPSLIAFKKVCVDPLATDRSGAADELTLQEFPMVLRSLL